MSDDEAEDVAPRVAAWPSKRPCRPKQIKRLRLGDRIAPPPLYSWKVPLPLFIQSMEAMRYRLLLEHPDIFQPGESEYFEIWEDKVCGTGHFPVYHSEADYGEA